VSRIRGRLVSDTINSVSWGSFCAEDNDLDWLKYNKHCVNGVILCRSYGRMGSGRVKNMSGSRPVPRISGRRVSDRINIVSWGSSCAENKWVDGFE